MGLLVCRQLKSTRLASLVVLLVSKQVKMLNNRIHSFENNEYRERRRLTQESDDSFLSENGFPASHTSVNNKTQCNQLPE